MSSSKGHSSSKSSSHSSSKHKDHHHKSSSSKDKDSSHKDNNKEKEKPKSEHLSKGFLCKPAFHNTLPTAPSGPFFRPLSLYNNSNNSSNSNKMLQYAIYQVSTLEKSCIWQPHYGPELGLKLDLADQDTILPSDSGTGSKNVIDTNEMRYLSESRVRANKRYHYHYCYS